ESVAEYVITVALVLLRGAYFSTRAVEAGTWPRQMLSQGREAAGKTLGIVGYGSIGQLTARKAAALGMRVVTFDPVVASPEARPILTPHIAGVTVESNERVSALIAERVAAALG